MIAKLDNLAMFLRTVAHFGIQITGVSAEDLYNDQQDLALVVLVALMKWYLSLSHQE